MVKRNSPNARKNPSQARLDQPFPNSPGQRFHRRLPILFFFLLALVPLLLLQWGGDRYVKDNIAVKIGQSSIKRLVQAETLLEMSTEMYEELSSQLQVDFDKQTLIKEYINDHSAMAAAQLRQEFNAICPPAPNIRCLTLAPLHGQTTALKTSLSCPPTNAILVQQALVYQEALAVPGQICWGVVEQDLALVRIINDLTTGEPLCAFAVVFYGPEISQLLNPDRNDRFPAEQSPYLILVNAQGTILASPFPAELGTAVNAQFGKDIMGNLLQNSNGTGAFTTRLQKDKFLVAYHYLPSKDWYLLSLEPYDYWFKEINALQIPVFLLILLLVSIFAVLFSYALSATSSSPRPCTAEAEPPAASVPEEEIAQS